MMVDSDHKVYEKATDTTSSQVEVVEIGTMPELSLSCKIVC